MLPKKKVYWRKYCCVKSCANNSSLPRISFFKFPKDPERCAVWLQNCRRLDLAKFSSEHLSVNYKVCSAHFQCDMFAGLSGNKLKKNAIPKPISDEEECKAEIQSLINTNFENCNTNETNNTRDFSINNLDPPILFEEKPELLSLNLNLSSPTDISDNIKFVQPNNPCVFIVCNGVPKTEPPSEMDIAKESEERTFGALLEDSTLLKPFDLSSTIENVIPSYNRAITVAKTNSTVLDILENLSKDQISLLKSDLAQGTTSKRVLFLGESLNEHTNTKFKQCPLCEDQFNTGRLFELHLLRVHKNYCPFKCNRCGKEFKKAILYNEHLKNFELYQECDMKKCRICKTMISKSNFRTHFSLHKTFRCDLCTKTFLTALYLNKHRLTHQNDAEIENFESKPKLKLEENLLCPICGKILKGRSSMRYHLKTHSERRNFLCDECPKAFKSNSILQKHKELTHGVRRVYECSLCDKKVKNREGLREHIKLKHSDRSTHKCVACGMEFLRMDYYRRHVARHMNVGSRKCRYVKKESGDSVFACKFCQKNYPNVYALRVHLLKSHLKNGARPKCRVCGLSFGDDSARIRHEKRHRDPKKFELTCTVCWSRFGSKERLKTHLEKHKNSRRRQCDECGESFPSKYLLSHHKTERHFDEALEAQRRDALLEDGLGEFTIH